MKLAVLALWLLTCARALSLCVTNLPHFAGVAVLTVGYPIALWHVTATAPQTEKFAWQAAAATIAGVLSIMLFATKIP